VPYRRIRTRRVHGAHTRSTLDGILVSSHWSALRLIRSIEYMPVLPANKNEAAP